MQPARPAARALGGAGLVLLAGLALVSGCGGTAQPDAAMLAGPSGTLLAGAVQIRAVEPQDMVENQDVLLTLQGERLSAVQAVEGRQMQCQTPQAQSEQQLQLRCRTGRQGSDELRLWIAEPGGSLRRWRGLFVTVSAPRSNSRLPPSGALPERCHAAGSDAWVPCASQSAQSLSPEQDGMRQSVAVRFAPVWREAAAGPAYSLEECVADQLTGLVWEGKTRHGWRAGHRLFSNYLLDLYDPVEQASYDGNVDHYLATARQQGICGYFDWRLPRPEELQSLLDYGRAAPEPMLPPEYFPHAPTEARYWSGAAYADSALLHWAVDFSSGVVAPAARQEGLALRLVRGPGGPP